MRNYLSQQGRAFDPQTLALLVEAFDAAWAVVQRFDGVTEENRADMRNALAKRIVELWDASCREPKALRDAVLSSFSLPRPEAEAATQ